MDGGLTALVLGATGLVGSELLRQLAADERCARVIALGRRATGFDHEKVEDRVIDFDAPDAWRDAIQGDVLYSALGTTIKKAGSQAAQHKVDYTYQLRVAEAAARAGVDTYVLVSATGASPQSLIFYSRMKGELERDVSALGFRRVCILRPGLLRGARSERRPAEQVAAATLGLLPAWSSLARVRPIDASDVARAARAITFSSGLEAPSRPRSSLPPGSGLPPEVYEAADLFRLAPLADEGPHRQTLER